MVEADNIIQWRARVFTRLMSFVLLFAFFTAVPSAALAIGHGKMLVALMDALALAWILAIWRFTDVPYAIRVSNYLAMLFVVGTGSMITVGPLGLCYLIAVPIMAVILMGMRTAFVTLGLSSACVLMLGLAGYSELTVADLPKNSLVGVSAFVLNFMCVSGFVTLACGKLLQGLSQSLNEVHGVAVSLDERQAALHAANDELCLTSAALAGLNEMVLIIRVAEGAGAPQAVIFANAAFKACSGYADQEIIGCSLRKLQGRETDPAAIARIAATFARCKKTTEQLVLYSKAGAPYWIEVDVVPFSSKGSAITHWVFVGRDITAQRRAAESIHQLAFYDVLTGLPNRRLLMDRLDAALVKAQAGYGLGGILYIDLDNFKAVNDARGHATGDALLNHVTARLRQAVRACDTVARLGGDEFVVLLDDLGRDGAAATSAALAMAEGLSRALRLPVSIDSQMYRSSGSIGVTLTTPGQTAHDILREADTAMYHAKAAGRNGIALFKTAMLVAAEQTLTMERDLESALRNQEMTLRFQLQVDAQGHPVGAEALLRWQRNGITPTAPDVFIPVAERSGLIVPIGAWVLREACHAWHALNRAGFPLPLSINVSPRQFREPGFVNEVKSTLLATGVSAHQIILEVTEGLLIDNFHETTTAMRELAQLGVRFSIDDFGTGYSNLAYLSEMPLYELKIDKSFMKDIPGKARATAIVQSIMAMAGHLDLRVMAEGIETTAQATYLRSHGAPYMQGYLFGRPMMLSEMVDYLLANGALRADQRDPGARRQLAN